MKDAGMQITIASHARMINFAETTISADNIVNIVEREKKWIREKIALFFHCQCGPEYSCVNGLCGCLEKRYKIII
jgi:hypothetical protein